jgi:hypothetical protein
VRVDQEKEGKNDVRMAEDSLLAEAILGSEQDMHKRKRKRKRGAGEAQDFDKVLEEEFGKKYPRTKKEEDAAQAAAKATGAITAEEDELDDEIFETGLDIP